MRCSCESGSLGHVHPRGVVVSSGTQSQRRMLHHQGALLGFDYQSYPMKTVTDVVGVGIGDAVIVDLSVKKVACRVSSAVAGGRKGLLILSCPRKIF